MGHRLDGSIQEVVNDVFGLDASTLPPNASQKTEPPLSWQRHTRKAQELIEDNEKKKRLYRVVSIEAARIDAVRDLERCA
jgi:hypothetical protein